VNGASSEEQLHSDNEEHDVLTADELAVMLRLDRKTVYAAIKAGDIPGVRTFGRAIRISRATVVAWLASGQGRSSRPRRRLS
jgi:excisionase family DNA binding protein